MDLRELRYFVAVYEEQNLTAAARRCFISQPSVSAAIASIERELGAQLFTRHKKGVMRTSAADALYPRAKRLLDDAASMRALFAVDAAKETFSLGLLRSLDIARATRLLAPIAATPGLRLQLVGAGDPADARIVEKRMARDNESFARLWRERYVLALPRRHPGAVTAPIGDEEFKELPFIARCHCEAADAFAATTSRLRIVAVADSEEWALALVAAGVGASIVPEGSVGARDDIVVRPLANRQFVREIGVAYGGGAPLSPTALAAIAAIRAQASSDVVGSRRKSGFKPRPAQRARIR